MNQVGQRPHFGGIKVADVHWDTHLCITVEVDGVLIRRGALDARSDEVHVNKRQNLRHVGSVDARCHRQNGEGAQRLSEECWSRTLNRFAGARAFETMTASTSRACQHN